jgi:transcriptional regulator with GAF, ATPase, and Fis domain
MSDNTEQKLLQREVRTAHAFVEIVDSLVDEFDVIDLLTGLAERTVDLLEAAAAGILLADSSGQLRVMAASNERVELLELFQIQNEEGPCYDSFRTGKVVVSAEPNALWPRFGVESTRAGYLAVCAVPLRLRDSVLGCLNLFMEVPVALSTAEVALAQALADVASIAIVQDQLTRQAAIREGQLQHALTSRIAIEQAKGMISERSGLTMEHAFDRLRSYARATNRGLTEVAESMVSGTLSVDTVSRGR